MISNERQYRTTLRQRRKLAHALDDLLGSHGGTLALAENDLDPVQDRDAFLQQLQRASLTGQIADLDSQLHEYEQLRDGQLTASRVHSLADLPDALVRARIASGLSQRDLAARLHMREQQIQRYEAERYAGASLTRLREVMDALGMEFDVDVALPTTAAAADLRRRLLGLGFDRRVVDGRLLRDVHRSGGEASVLATAGRLARLLAVPVQALLSSATPAPALATTARFQAPRNASAGGLDAYTRYAEGIADIVLRATTRVGPTRPVGTPEQVRTAIDTYVTTLADGTNRPDSQTLLKATLRFAASIGVVVVGLRDPGAFNGACFGRAGRFVVVLKHTSEMSARWLAVLLHELDHIGDPRTGDARTWVELGDVETWSDTPDERHANLFAADVLFYGRADAVLAQTLAAADGSVERLKAVVPVVAEHAEVPTDVLANYLAFQLNRRGINWWPTATKLQVSDDPWRAVTDHLLTQIDFAAIHVDDRQALLDALGP